MEKQVAIPCANCPSWKQEERKFSCNPDNCKQLNMWLLEHAPQLKADPTHMQVRLPEIAVQYVV